MTCFKMSLTLSIDTSIGGPFRDGYTIHTKLLDLHKTSENPNNCRGQGVRHRAAHVPRNQLDLPSLFLEYLSSRFQ